MTITTQTTQESIALQPDLPPGGLAVALRGHCWAIPAFLMLILVRALLLNGDPSDFPMDRNITAAFNIERLVKDVDRQTRADTGRKILSAQQEAPEFPFVTLSAGCLAFLGLDPLLAARLFSLAAALLTGLGLYVLGRRLGPPALGLATLWLYALNPLSVFMGRCMLPDTFMVAAMVWSLVAAGAGQSGARGRRAIGMTAWLIVAALAKLPAVFFAPAAATALGQTLGWRRRATWIHLAVATLVTYLATCLWYGILPWAPLEGLSRISENTNNVMGSWKDLLGALPMQVAVSRLVLALTIPGLALALVGWVLLQARSGQRLWLNVWFALSLLFVVLTIQANTYWAYALAPAGCLLAALALVDLYRIGRWPVLAPLALAAVAALWMCPSLDLVKSYLAPHPEYKTMGQVAARRATQGSVLYYGRVPRDIAYYARRPGLSLTDTNVATMRAYVRSLGYRYLLSNRMLGDEIMDDLFASRPIIETRRDGYVLCDLSQRVGLGELVDRATLTSPTLSLDLAGQLKILSVTASPERLAPGGKLELAIVFEKGPQYKGVPSMALEFVHQPTGEAFSLDPLSGGAAFTSWSLPLLQTPDFLHPGLQRLRYTFEWSAQMPAGPYKLRFSLMADRRRRLILGEPQLAPLSLDALPPATLAKAPLQVNPRECLWVAPLFLDATTWLGGARPFARLTSDGHLYARPNLPPGDYELCVTGSGIPAGATQESIWPQLRFQKPGLAQALQPPFDSPVTRTVRYTFHWYGAQDFLHLSIANPKVDLRPPTTFPLYLGDVAGGSRSINLDKIEIRPVPGG